MKMLGRSLDDKGRVVLTIEQSFLFFFKRTRKFVAASHKFQEYYDWLELPNMTMAGDLQFQLNRWKKETDA